MNKPTTLEVVVDTWPDFKVIICRPDPKVSSLPLAKSFTQYLKDTIATFFFLTSQNKHALELMKIVSYYSTDEQILRKMLAEENAVDWSTYFLIGGELRAPGRM